MKMILTADLHIREDVPQCRMDDYLNKQWQKLEVLRDSELAILAAGDIFHHWKPSPWLLSMTNLYLPMHRLYAVAGQHDLPQHNDQLFERCGLRTLNGMGAMILDCEGHELGELVTVYGCGWGQTPKSILKSKGRKVLVWHNMTWTHKIPFPGCKEASADKLLKKYPEYDLILTGDNHIPFTVEREGRLLVNPGSMMRMTGGQSDHHPRYYVWDTKDNTATARYWDIKKDDVTREHIDVAGEREQRTSDFVARLKHDMEVGFSYRHNMKLFLKKNPVRDEVKRLVWKSMEVDNDVA